MSKTGQVPENPKDPKNFGERLPDVAAEKLKKLPTGAARRIAVKAAKEVATLAWETLRQGGLPPVGRLMGLAWRAIGIYRESRAEALAELRDTYLTGRNIWATGIMTGVETSGYNVSGDREQQQDIRDFLGKGDASTGTAPAAMLGKDPEQARLQAVADSLKSQEEDVKLFLKRIEASPPAGDAKTELEQMAQLLKRGQDNLTAQANTLPNEQGNVVVLTDPNDDNPPFTVEQQNQEDGFLNQWLSISSRLFDVARKLPPGVPTKVRGRIVTYFPAEGGKPDFKQDDWRAGKYQEAIRIVTPAGTKLHIVLWANGQYDHYVNGKQPSFRHGDDEGDRIELSLNHEMFTSGLGIAEKNGDASDRKQFESTYDAGHKRDRIRKLKEGGPVYTY